MAQIKIKTRLIQFFLFGFKCYVPAHSAYHNIEYIREQTSNDFGSVNTSGTSSLAVLSHLYAVIGM